MIILDFPQCKSKMAFHFSVEKLFRQGPVYMWTLTFKEAVCDDYAMYAWKGLSEKLQYQFKMCRGLRIVERHPGQVMFGDLELSHGLHFHLLLNQRIPKDWLDKVGAHWGFGWKWVRKVSKEDALYCGKYLTKENGTELKKGGRRWGSIGGFQYIKVRDVEIDSTFHRNFRRIQNRVKITQVTPDLLHSIYLNSELHGPIENWPNQLIQYGGRSKELITPEMLGFPAKSYADPTMKSLSRKRRPLYTSEAQKEKIAKRWKAIGNQRQRRLSEAKPSEKILETAPGDSPVKKQDSHLDISDNYWDTFPAKQAGTDYASKGVYVIKPFDYVDPGQH